MNVRTAATISLSSIAAVGAAAAYLGFILTTSAPLAGLAVTVAGIALVILAVTRTADLAARGAARMHRPVALAAGIAAALAFIIGGQASIAAVAGSVFVGAMFTVLVAASIRMARADVTA